MLIAKLTHLGHSTNLLVTPNVNTFTFKDISLTESSIATISWTYNNLVGAPIIVEGVNNSDEYTISIEDTAHSTNLVMTVVDDAGRLASASCLIVNDGLGNISILKVDITATIFPGGLVTYEFEESEEVILGSAIYMGSPFFSIYQLDYTNDGMYDISQSNLDNISNTYASTTTVTSRFSIVDIPNGISIDTIFAEISFEPVISNPIDIIIEGNIDCSELEISSQTKNYIEKLVARGGVDNSEMEFLGLEVVQNCCNNVVNVQLAPRYQFTLTEVPGSAVATPTQVTIGGNDYDVYTSDLLLGGIDSSLITSIVYTTTYNSGTGNTSTTSLTLESVEYLIEDPVPSGFPIIVETKTIIVTTTAGFVYTITYTITPDPNPVSITIDITNIEYPDFPTGISVTENPTNTVIVVNAEAFNQETLVDGIYQITLNDSEISNSYITGCAFVDCETYCLIVRALAKGCNPIIKILYDALVQFNNCTDIPCNHVCDLYAYLESLLDECDCTIYQNGLTKTRSGGCKTCK